MVRRVQRRQGESSLAEPLKYCVRKNNSRCGSKWVYQTTADEKVLIRNRHCIYEHSGQILRGRKWMNERATLLRGNRVPWQQLRKVRNMHKNMSVKAPVWVGGGAQEAPPPAENLLASWWLLAEEQTACFRNAALVHCSCTRGWRHNCVQKGSTNLTPWVIKKSTDNREEDAVRLVSAKTCSRGWEAGVFKLYFIHAWTPQRINLTFF